VRRHISEKVANSGPKPAKCRSSMKNHRPTNCVKCDAELQAPGSRGGRPSRFCSEGCKVSAEAEMRRLNVLLRKLEAERARRRLSSPYLDPARNAEVIARYDEEIAVHQARFDHLAGVPEGRLMTEDEC